MLILAIGLTLTAETRLGASALTAIPFVVSLRLSLIHISEPTRPY